MGDNIKRIKTGISGLDTMMDGGIPEMNQVVIAGGPGTGKTMFTLQFAYYNAKIGIPTSFIALEEQTDMIIRNFVHAFPEFTDFTELLENGKLIIDTANVSSRVQPSMNASNYSFSTMVSDIEDVIRRNNSRCLVIDSISFLNLLLKDIGMYRKSLLALSNNLRKIGLTTIFTMEVPYNSRGDLKFSDEFFIFDGILALYENAPVDKDRERKVEILKMRGSQHSFASAQYKITSAGIVVDFAGK
jgi:KaiC/GvpD/RAD55 family RecA-like ATPase